MKIRLGFVSNSSSSSFVIIDSSGQYCKIKPTNVSTNTYSIGKTGETEFGWGPDRIVDVDSKINWAAMQAQYARDAAWFKMIEEVILQSGIKAVDCRIALDYEEVNGYNESWGYIDHQSTTLENGSLAEIFESPEKLKDFLLGVGSYVQIGNDNE
jgi:hypothetical protein